MKQPSAHSHTRYKTLAIIVISFAAELHARAHMHTSTHAHVQESDHEADLCRLYDKGLWQASADEASCVTVCCSCRSFSTGMLKLCGWHHLLRLLAWNSLELGALSAMYECRLGLLAFYRFPFAKTWRASLPGGLVDHWLCTMTRLRTRQLEGTPTWA